VQVAETTPFFCLPGAGDPGMVVGALAQHLGPWQAVYSFDLDQPFTSGGGTPSIPAIAAGLVREVQSIQPLGPYYLGGYSSGGIVAFEMARQLCVLGETIALLVLIDSYGPGFPKPVTRFTVEWRHWKRIRVLGTAAKVRYLAGRIGRGIRKVGRALKLQTARDGAQSDDASRRRNALKLAGRSCKNYLEKLPTYPGPVTLLRAAEQPDFIAWSFNDPENGWGTVASRVRVVPVPASHGSLAKESGIHSAADILKIILRDGIGEGTG
jgi:thioesterase domain-containing protein